MASHPTQSRSTAAVTPPRLWRWWLPILLVALAPVALVVDQAVVDALTEGASAARYLNAVRALEGLFAVGIWSIVVAHLPTARRRWQAVGIIAATLAISLLLQTGLQRQSFGEAASTVRFLIGALLWAMVIVVFSRFYNAKRMVIALAAAVLLATIVTHAMKWWVGRARPELDLGPLTFRPLLVPTQGVFASFPSGHSSAAAAFAAACCLFFPRATPFFGLWMLLVGVERMVTDNHFPSDVLVGYAIGIGSVLLVRAWLGEHFFRRTAIDPQRVGPPPEPAAEPAAGR